MEASIGQPSPPSPLTGRKIPRPHYRAMWEKEWKLALEMQAQRDQAIHRADRWATAAVIEGLALAIAVVIWLAR